MSFLKYQNNSPLFLNNYLKYIRFVSFNSENTVNETYFDLRTFLRYIKLVNCYEKEIENITVEKFKNIDIKDITIEDMNCVTQHTLKDYIFFLKYTLNNCPKTRNRKLASLKHFFEFLEINNHIAYNPTKFVDFAKVEKRKPKYLDLKQSKKLLSQMITLDHKYKIRNYAITCIFLNCCIRLSELTKINLTDIKLDDKSIKIRGKGSKDRILYLNDAVCEAINEYLKVRPALPKTNLDYNALFISNRNQRISKRTVQDIISKCSIDSIKLHAHTLRHSGATLMYTESNTDIPVIQKTLGHKTIEATQIYVQLSEKRLKDIMDNCAISSILEKKGEL